MGYSNSFKASQARAQKVFDALDAKDPRFDEHDLNFLVVRHDDGSELRLKNAFYVCDSEDQAWTWIFTEHLNFHVVSRRDVTITVERRHKGRMSDGNY